MNIGKIREQRFYVEFTGIDYPKQSFCSIHILINYEMQ